MTTDILELDSSTTSTSTSTATAAPTDASASTASAPEAATVASGSLASDPTPASAAPSDSFTLGTSEEFDVMESQLDLRDPKPTKPTDAAVASSTATAADNTAAVQADLGPFTADQIELASHYGFTVDDAKSFGTPDALQKVLTAMDRRELSAGKSQSQPDATVEDRQAAVPSDDTATPSSLADDFGIEKLDLDLSGWDDEAAEMFQKINDHHQAQLEKLAAKQAAAPQAEVVALKEQLAAIEARAAEAEGERFERDMDSYFSGLGDAFADKFGTDPMRSLAKDSPHSQARNEFVREFAALRAADARLGRPEMPREQLLKRTLASRYADQFQEIARKQVRAEVEGRRSQSVEKPTQRTVPVETGEAAASNFVNSFLKDRGVDTGESLLSALSEIE